MLPGSRVQTTFLCHATPRWREVRKVFRRWGSAERFNQAACEKHGSIVFIGSHLIITSKDRKEFLEQVRAEQAAYDVIKELHDKIIRLLHENNQANAATTNLR